MSQEYDIAYEALKKSLINYAQNNKELAKVVQDIIVAEKHLSELKNTERFCISQEDSLNDEINTRLAYFDDGDERVKSLVAEYVAKILLDETIKVGE